MQPKFLLFISLFIFPFTILSQSNEFLTLKEIKNDLQFLDSILQHHSSYQGLNSYNYKNDFKEYLKNSSNSKIDKTSFGLFLSKVIGKIGDRHSYIKGYDLPENRYLPFSFAPYKEQVLILDYDRTTREYRPHNQKFPYLKAINNIPIKEIIDNISLLDKLAPKKSFQLRAVRELRDIESVFRVMNIELSNSVKIILTNEKQEEKEITVALVEKKNRGYLWDERFHKKDFYFSYDNNKLNDKDVLKNFFSIKNKIAYLQITAMIAKEDSPTFFKLLEDFMNTAKNTKALIIDVRDNGGGTRDLIQELAGYIVHPDSIYIANVTKQRGILPLNKESVTSLNNRYLFTAEELDNEEKLAANQFIKSFKPMYSLDEKKFSEYYYYVLNGKKLSKNKFHYKKPIYILANERTFSASSILVASFKGLPNVKIVGVTTDGSSGNSKRFELPNSGFKGKISTMVSFQKDGKILDGFGTKPDIKIERNKNQIYMKEDYQLNRLMTLINYKK